jgi:hypothetical protein
MITKLRRKRAEGRVVRAERIDVARVGDYYLARMYVGGVMVGEGACDHKRDIGWMCAEMCRWYDKSGNGFVHGFDLFSKMAVRARKRMWRKWKLAPPTEPRGRIIALPFRGLRKLDKNH